MDLYNEDLKLVGQVNENYNQMFNQQVEFVLNLLGNNEKYTNIIKNRLDNTILIECDAKKGYRVCRQNDKLIKLKFSNNAGAFVGYAKQVLNNSGWDITNGVYIRKGAYDMSNPETSRKTLPHEIFHTLSCNVEANFDQEGYCYTKSGFKVFKYDKDDNEIDVGLNAKLLTEGTTEMLANMFNNTLEPHAYSFSVFIARILNCAKTKPSLLEAYFSDDIKDIQAFVNTFDKSQTSVTAKDLINAHTSELIWKEKDCPKLIKGCLQYTINSLNTIDELKSFYNEIKQTTISIADSITLNIGEDHKNKVVKFVRQTLVDLLDERKQQIKNQINAL